MRASFQLRDRTSRSPIESMTSLKNRSMPQMVGTSFVTAQPNAHVRFGSKPHRSHGQNYVLSGKFARRVTTKGFRVTTAHPSCHTKH